MIEIRPTEYDLNRTSIRNESSLEKSLLGVGLGLGLGLGRGWRGGWALAEWGWGWAGAVSFATGT